MPSSVVFICLIPLIYANTKLTFSCRKIILLFLANQISVRLQALATPNIVENRKDYDMYVLFWFI